MDDGTGRFTIIIFEITNKCNKNCKYCIKMPKKEDKTEHMKIEDYKYVVSCINKKDREKFKRVILTGGEPLLHPKCIEIISLMRKDFPKAEIILASNGKLIAKLPQKNLRVLPDIKNIMFRVSDYPKWNDNIKKMYDGNYKMPNTWKKLINKLTLNNKFTNYIALKYRFPKINLKILKFLHDPLKRGNVYFIGYSEFWDPYDDPNISKEMAKKVRKLCCYHIYIIGKKLYNCCMVEQHERYYNTDSVSIKFDENWKRNFFKLPTWKGCIHCRMGINKHRILNINKKLISDKKYVNFDTIRKKINVKDHM